MHMDTCESGDCAPLDMSTKSQCLLGNITAYYVMRLWIFSLLEGSSIFQMYVMFKARFKNLLSYWVLFTDSVSEVLPSYK